MDEIQAAFLKEKLLVLDEWNDRRKVIANYYLNNIKNTKIILPYNPDWADSVWHIFTIRTKQREKLVEYLHNHNINTMIHYPIAPHKQPAYSEFNHLNFPISECIHEEIISLPIGPHLKLDDVSFITNTLNKF